MSIKRIFSFFGWPILLLPTAIFYLGVSLNAICTIANDGVMPVRAVDCENAYIDPDDPVHVCMTKTTHMNFLADTMGQNNGIVSIGDQFEYVGIRIQKECLYLWLMIAFFCLVRREKFYIE